MEKEVTEIEKWLNDRIGTLNGDKFAKPVVPANESLKDEFYTFRLSLANSDVRTIQGL